MVADSVGYILTGEPDLTFWPKARLRQPGFLLSFGGEATTLVKAYNILSSICSESNCWVITPDPYEAVIRSELPKLGSRVVTEPASRSDFNALALAIATTKELQDNTVVIAIPSSLYVIDGETFAKNVNDAVSLALSTGRLITIASTPTYPEPEYYYLKKKNNAICDFLEKPGELVASKALETHNYLWCSGVLVFTVAAWWKFIRRYHKKILPILKNIELATGTGFYKRVIAEEYTKLRSNTIWSAVYPSAISAKALIAVETDARWEYLNSWRSVGRIGTKDGNGNQISGPALLVESKECIVESDKTLLVTVGVQDLIIISSADVTLVCNKNRQGELHTALDMLRQNGMRRYL